MRFAAEIALVWICGSLAIGPLLCWLFWYGKRRDRAARNDCAAENRVYQ